MCATTILDHCYFFYTFTSQQRANREVKLVFDLLHINCQIKRELPTLLPNQAIGIKYSKSFHIDGSVLFVYAVKTPLVMFINSLQIDLLVLNS